MIHTDTCYRNVICSLHLQCRWWSVAAAEQYLLSRDKSSRWWDTHVRTPDSTWLRSNSRVRYATIPYHTSCLGCNTSKKRWKRGKGPQKKRRKFQRKSYQENSSTLLKICYVLFQVWCKDQGTLWTSWSTKCEGDEKVGRDVVQSDALGYPWGEPGTWVSCSKTCRIDGHSYNQLV